MTMVPLPRTTPAQKGVDPEMIANFLDDVKSTGLELHGFMFYQSGAVIAETWWRPYASHRRHVQHSATKSWTAAGIGLLVDDGVLSLDDKVISFFPDDLPDTVSENLAAMTIRDLLTMRTGHLQGISGGSWRGLKGSWIRAFLQEPVADRPGEHFIYSSGSSFMLSAVATAVTGKTLYEICNERLFRPMGLGSLKWDIGPGGINPGGNGLTCTLEDSLKLGVLHLHKGQWEGKTLLSERWVSEATRNQVTEAWLGKFDGKHYLSREESGEAGISRREGYGYQWWMTSNGGFCASGVFGQKCLVYPELDLVIAFNSGLSLQDTTLSALVAKWLIPASRARGAATTTESSRLSELQRDAAMPAIEGKHSSLTQPAIQGLYRVDSNEDNIREIIFGFDDDRCHFTLVDNRGTHNITAGLKAPIEGVTTMTGYYLHHAYQPDFTSVVAEARWKDEQTLEMYWCFVETAFSDTAICTFKNNQVYFERSVNVNAGATCRPTIIGTLCH